MNQTLSQHNREQSANSGSSSPNSNFLISYLPSTSVLKAKLVSFKMRMCGNLSDPMILSWNVGSLVTILLPLFTFMVARLTNEEEWNYNNNNNNEQNQNGENYYDNPYANPDNYDEYGNYVGPTHWWQFWKKNNNNNNNGEGGGDGNEMRAPWWCKLQLSETVSRTMCEYGVSSQNVYCFFSFLFLQMFGASARDKSPKRMKARVRSSLCTSGCWFPLPF
jgi:hypothetical protein